MGKKYFDTKAETLESSILGVWAEAAKKQEGLNAVNPKALKKKFDDRKDKDIDNDGDVDDSDEYLHNRRKTVSKAVKSKDEGNAFGMALKAAKEKGEKTFVVSGKTYKVKEAVEVEESYEIGTNEYRDHALKVTPGETDPEWEQARDFKVASMKEALAKIWGMEEGNNPFIKKEDDDKALTKNAKSGKTMTGKKAAIIDTKPKIKD